jgi:hypothetical protein
MHRSRAPSIAPDTFFVAQSWADSITDMPGFNLRQAHRYDRDRRGRYDTDTTVGVGPGGVTVGPRQRCRMETTTIERDDGRRITRQERRCD